MRLSGSNFTNSKTLVGWWMSRLASRLLNNSVSRPTVTCITFDLPECKEPQNEKKRKQKQTRKMSSNASKKKTTVKNTKKKKNNKKLETSNKSKNNKKIKKNEKMTRSGSVEQWFDAGQIALGPADLRLVQLTSVPEASNLRLLCSSVSVKKNCSDGANLTTDQKTVRCSRQWCK